VFLGTSAHLILRLNDNQIAFIFPSLKKLTIAMKYWAKWSFESMSNIKYSSSFGLFCFVQRASLSP
jgi:hypothetical protein